MLGTGNRPIGVKASTSIGDQAESGAPRTLVAMTDASFRIMQYFDERGRPVSSVVMKIGNDYYMPPNSVEWCAALRPVSTWMKEKIYQHDAKNKPVNVSSEDSVEVLPDNPIAVRIAGEADAIVKSRSR